MTNAVVDKWFKELSPLADTPEEYKLLKKALYEVTLDAVNKGFDDGFSDGLKAGVEKATKLDSDAYKAGFEDGRYEGYNDGYGEGYNEGYDSGFGEGYDAYSGNFV